MSDRVALCYGFGEREDNCPNAPGGAWSPYFCPDCDEKRVAHISKRFEEISARFALGEADE